MQRVLCLKQFSQNPTNFPNSISSFSSPKPYLPSFCKSNPTQSHVSSPSRHSISQFFTSSSHSANSSQSLNYILQNLNRFRINKGFLSYTTANTLLKGSISKGLLHYGRLGFPKSQFSATTRFQAASRAWDSWFRRFSGDELVLGLIIANVGVFMLWRIADRQFMVNNFMISLDNFKSGRLHTLISSAFSHIEMHHIISNMIGLYFFGNSISRTFGPGFMLKLYLSGAVAGSVFFLVHKAFISGSSKGELWSNDPSRVPGLGASGAVNAVMLLDIFLFPKKTIYLEFIIPVPAILLGIFIIGHDMLRIIQGDNRISGSAHLGGAAVAALAWARLRKGRRFF